MIHSFSSNMKYYERPFVSCVSHQHLKYKRNYRYCTGESIITPHKLKALLHQSTQVQWSPYLSNPSVYQEELRIAKIPYLKSWPLQSDITSTHFYVVGIPTMFIELSQALQDTNREQAIVTWLDKYMDTQYVISVPIFSDTRYPDESWYVSNHRSLNVFQEFIDNEPHTLLYRRCYTLGSVWLLLYALVSLNELSPTFVLSLMEDGRGTYVNISESMRYFYLGLGIPMACDIIETVCKSWFKPELYQQFFNRHYTYYMEWLYLNEGAFLIFDSTLLSMDHYPIRDIIKNLLKTEGSSSKSIQYFPWLYPFLAQLVKSSKKEWRYWNQEYNNVFKILQNYYFKKKSSLSHLFYTMTHCLIYLYTDVPSKHRVIQLWNQLLDYCRELSLPKYFSKILIHFYKNGHLIPVPIYFLKSIPLHTELFLSVESTPFETLYQAIKRASLMDLHATYYLNYLEKRALTKIHCLKHLDPYLVGILMQNYFKEHRAELFS